MEAMNPLALEDGNLKPYRAHSSFNRSVRDYLGSLKAREYSDSTKFVRLFRDGDLRHVLHIYEKSFSNRDNHQIIKYSRQFRNIFYVYELNGVVVGYLGFYVHLHREGLKIIQKATLFSVAIEEKMRNRGICTTAYRECLAELKRNGVQTVNAYINVNNSVSLAIHDTIGFNKIRRIKNLYGAEDGYHVELRLQDYQYHPET
jgi:L-amino acid N-acyltransferase YncA